MHPPRSHWGPLKPCFCRFWHLSSMTLISWMTWTEVSWLPKEEWALENEFLKFPSHHKKQKRQLKAITAVNSLRARLCHACQKFVNRKIQKTQHKYLNSYSCMIKTHRKLKSSRKKYFKYKVQIRSRAAPRACVQCMWKCKNRKI